MKMQEALARLYAPLVPRDSRGIWSMVTFVNRAGPQRMLGPLQALWLDGRVIRGERHGVVLGANYYRLETEGGVHVRFAGDDHPNSDSFGRFGRFSIIDRLVYADGKAFAIFNPRVGTWLCYDAGRQWPSMVVSPSPG